MGEQILSQSRPSPDDRAAWLSYWRESNQPWRTEPEISTERQAYLEQCRATAPSIQRGIYAFKNVRLQRADVEWLLATHEQGRGPIDWQDQTQRSRKGLDLRGADLREENLQYLPLARLLAGVNWTEEEGLTVALLDAAAIQLDGADLSSAHLEGAHLCAISMRRATLYGTHLEHANLAEAHIENTLLYGGHLDYANLEDAHVEGVYFFKAHLDGANLQGAFFDAATTLDHTAFGKREGTVASFADAHWHDANLSIIDWSSFSMLGDEYTARQAKTEQGKAKSREERLEDYLTAVRANRQIAVVLREQGMNEDAMRFAYKAQRLQRTVLFYQRHFLQYGFSLFLDLLAGYGYKPVRCFIAYLIVIFGFASGYYLIGPNVHLTLTPLEAAVFSVTSFHGRGFSPSQSIGLGNPLTVLAALEAFIGLTIEITFIATFTQRIFGK